MTIVVAPPPRPLPADEGEADRLLAEALVSLTPRDAAVSVAGRPGLPAASSTLGRSR
ncbi:MAG: hypothetical protein U1E33_02660 [Rhodospirillales bacterium]